MKTSFPSIEKIGIRIGAVTFLALVVYFMAMKWAGLSHIIELRFFNFAILAVGICYGINKFKHDSHESDFYLKGWGQGIFIAVIANALFATFIGLYISNFDDALLQRIKETTTIGANATGFHLFFAILMEGMASAAVITLAAMQYFKSVGRARHRTTVRNH
jgi:hypothetical protein